jgi:Nif-specific ferredoxin III
MAIFSVILPGGRVWTPQFIAAIDAEKCIGCGRCFKTCAHEVLQLMAVDEDGATIAIGEDDDDDDYEKKVMSIQHHENCVGCEACGRNCSKRCIGFAAAETDAVVAAIPPLQVEASMATIAAASA